MAWTYEEVTPTPIENAIVEKGFSNGVHKIYRVQSASGYVLHDNRLDYTEIDDVTLEETPKLGYTGQTVSCRYDYDFIANPFEFYAAPIDDIPENQIFGVGNSNHETI